MLDKQVYGIVNSAFHTAINLLGMPADYASIKDPTKNKKGIIIGFSGGSSDQTLVQSMGIEGKTITAKVEDFATPPEKFDQFVVNGQKHVADSVHLIHLNGTVIGYKIMTKGK
jgi:hypothetical protein